ncbi:NmrA-like family protein [Aspergillus lucknowensis]|uniref:NmrA-like family protein n=1 Tax=Aspergillus lucknowensis TaxID=176173 RepID=A0ABR4M5D7_9EURO
MSVRKVLVFGPTGGVGSAAARTAHSHGAEVFLAMRDTSKSIPGLTATEEQHSGRYERVQADLTQPDSVRVAVSKTGATHAFIYVVLGASPDHMRSTAETLKAAGIEFVVLLSSGGVQGDIRAVPPSDFVGYAHAQVELSLEEVFGPRGYVAIRPTFFASNAFWWQKQIVEDKEVKWAFPDLQFDYIAPEDIGAVAGTILSGAIEGEQENPVPLVGPEDGLSVAGAIETIARAINQPVKVTQVSPDENVQVLVAKGGTPEPLARFLIESFAKMNENQEDLRLLLAPARPNIQKYLKRPAMRFSEWAEQNKDKFEA